jgi:hypothetical protein
LFNPPSSSRLVDEPTGPAGNTTMRVRFSIGPAELQIFELQGTGDTSSPPMAYSDAATLLYGARFDAIGMVSLRNLLLRVTPGLPLFRMSDDEVRKHAARCVAALTLGITVRTGAALSGRKSGGGGGGGQQPQQPKNPQQPTPGNKPKPPGTPKPPANQPPATLKVTVLSVDGATQTFVGGAKVQLSVSGSGATFSAAQTGLAVFPSLAPGDYGVGIVLSGHLADQYKAPKDQALVTLASGQTLPITLMLTPRLLELVSVDDHFAPGHESLDIHYKISGLSDEPVRLRITSPHADVNPVFERELTDAEKADGEHTIAWDGKSSAQSGTLKDRHIHGLFSPYKAEVHHSDGLKGELPFKVLYHSLRLRQGPWTPDEMEPPKSETNAWVQYKLNELGYWGGPVRKDTQGYLKKAVIRYKANHKGLRETFYDKYTGTITAALTDALAKNENPRRGVEGDAFSDPKAEAKVWVEGLTYEVLRAGAGGAEVDDFGHARPPKEKQRLNRPLIPVEVEITLKAKNDAAVLAPAGVGPLRINWRFKDADEDVTRPFPHTAAEPTLARRYLEKALKTKGGRSGKGDNAHQDYAGIRSQNDATNCAAPFLLGDFCVPYTAIKDAGQKVVYTEACTDAAKYPKRLGKAGIFFRPSYIAGDDYQLTAEIDFTGRPNKGELEGFHGVTDVGSRMHVDSGTFRVWRDGRVAVSIGWPARKGSNEWAEVRDEFLGAYVDVDVGGIASKSITDVLTEAEYRAIVVARTKHKNPAKIQLHADAIVGVDLPKQGKMTPAAYRAAVRTFANDYWDAISVPLRRKLSANIRKEHPSGFVVVDFHTHRAVQVVNPANPAPQSFIAWTFSVGLPDSFVFADQMDPDKVYYVVAHEMGHNYWLKHWENAGGIAAHHDRDDHNCVMSYSNSNDPPLHAHQRPGQYTPHFCGKCILKLRGWNVDTAGLLPANSK